MSFGTLKHCTLNGGIGLIEVKCPLNTGIGPLIEVKCPLKRGISPTMVFPRTPL